MSCYKASVEFFGKNNESKTGKYTVTFSMDSNGTIVVKCQDIDIEVISIELQERIGYVCKELSKLKSANDIENQEENPKRFGIAEWQRLFGDSIKERERNQHCPCCSNRQLNTFYPDIVR